MQKQVFEFGESLHLFYCGVWIIIIVMILENMSNVLVQSFICYTVSIAIFLKGLCLSYQTSSKYDHK